MDWYWRCTVCGADVLKGAAHNTCSQPVPTTSEREPRTPFNGKPCAPITFAPHQVPKC